MKIKITGIKKKKEKTIEERLESLEGDVDKLKDDTYFYLSIALFFFYLIYEKNKTYIFASAIGMLIYAYNKISRIIKSMLKVRRK